jgi:hypothetical protein
MSKSTEAALRAKLRDRTNTSILIRLNIVGETKLSAGGMDFALHGNRTYDLLSLASATDWLASASLFLAARQGILVLAPSSNVQEEQSFVPEGLVGSDYKVVSDIAERNRLNPRVGFMVRVANNGMVYTWSGSSWDITLYGLRDPDTRTLYVDPANGDDESTGETQGSPLKLIMTALRKFHPPHLPPPLFETGDDRTVYVMANGAPLTLTEVVDIPSHVGTGGLVLLAEEQIVYSGLTEGSSPPSEISSSTHRFTFVAGPTMAAHALQGNAFLRPQDIESVWGTLGLVAAANEYGAVVDNAASTADVTFASTDSAGTTDRVVDMVRPLITWVLPEPEAGVSTWYGATLCRAPANVGVFGFKFAVQADQTASSFIEGHGNMQFQDGTGGVIPYPAGSPVVVSRCVFDLSGAVLNYPLSGEGIFANGVIFNPGASNTEMFCALRHSTVGNAIIDLSVIDTITLADKADLFFNYVRIQGKSSTKTKVIFEHSSFRTCSFDLFDAYIVYNACPYVYLSEGDHQNVGAHPAITGIGTTFAMLTLLDGSTGNTNVGVALRLGTKVLAAVNNTVTGNLGDQKVGALAVHSYAAQVDPTELCLMNLVAV